MLIWVVIKVLWGSQGDHLILLGYYWGSIDNTCQYVLNCVVVQLIFHLCCILVQRSVKGIMNDTCGIIGVPQRSFGVLLGFIKGTLDFICVKRRTLVSQGRVGIYSFKKALCKIYMNKTYASKVYILIFKSYCYHVNLCEEKLHVHVR